MNDSNCQNIILAPIPPWDTIVKMLCEQKISMQSSLADEAVRLGANLDQTKRLKLQGAMACAVDALRGLRERKCYRDWVEVNRSKRYEINKRYRVRNLDRVRASARARRPPPTSESRAYHRKWENENPEKVRLYYTRKYSKIKNQLKAKRSNPDYKAKMRKYLKDYRNHNSEELKKLNKNWRNENKQWMRDYIKRRKSENPLFSLKERLRSRIRNAFNGSIKKPARAEALLGCSFEHAKAHVESQFSDGMSWENRSSFEIDHTVPICAFNISDPEEVACAFSWRNLQPLKPIENWKKNDTLPNPLPDWLPPHIAARILARNA